ncbi:MAG: hypothetical protein GKR94_13965 [Gammaproteobacteria bacterium]|nr:hypothetical protein [Gammaproteobacteria bacterium]
MPNNYKILVCVLAIAVCVAVFWFDTASGIARWVTLALGPMMASAIWVLPTSSAGSV